MDIINIAATEDTPKIVLDIQNSICEFSGRSLPEDVVSFYKPVINWLNDFEKNPIPNTEFVFKLEYFNTASSKIILDILLKINNVHKTGNTMKIKWCYNEHDLDLKEAGEEYSELIEFPFEFTSYSQSIS